MSSNGLASHTPTAASPRARPSSSSWSRRRHEVLGVCGGHLTMVAQSRPGHVRARAEVTADRARGAPGRPRPPRGPSALRPSVDATAQQEQTDDRTAPPRSGTPRVAGRARPATPSIAAPTPWDRSIAAADRADRGASLVVRHAGERERQHRRVHAATCRWRTRACRRRARPGLHDRDDRHARPRPPPVATVPARSGPILSGILAPKMRTPEDRAAVEEEHAAGVLQADVADVERHEGREPGQTDRCRGTTRCPARSATRLISGAGLHRACAGARSTVSRVNNAITPASRATAGARRARPGRSGRRRARALRARDRTRDRRRPRPTSS